MRDRAVLVSLVSLIGPYARQSRAGAHSAYCFEIVKRERTWNAGSAYPGSACWKTVLPDRGIVWVCSASKKLVFL
jgi:hypothetical protein